MNRLKKKWWYIVTQIVYKQIFQSIGNKTIIYKPLQIDNPKNICIGNNLFIAEGAWLMGGTDTFATVKIGDGTTIGHYAHIIALHSVSIERNVLIADKVFISDCTHNYKDISVPIINQGVSNLSPVTIGEGSWLGENVCVCGASVGKHCVIGANSVVISDIPDYSVAVGSPARVVKKYDVEKNVWVKV